MIENYGTLHYTVSMKQPSPFDIPEIHIDKPIRLIELFGGIGAQAMALRDIGANFERYRLIEFDKYPVASYNAIHGTNFVPQDITKITGKDLGIVDVEKFTYLLTYSFPCQDLSLAGKQKGMAKGTNTRSGLLWEVERLLNEVENLPQVLVMENVPQVHGKKNMADFTSWINFLSKKGYTSSWQDLNAKDFGVPQNRKRCFMVSLLGDYGFEFPEPIELEKVMKDYLEESVDEKYYINNEKAEKLIQQLLKDRLCPTIPTCAGGIQPKVIVEDFYANREPRTYGKIAPTIRAERVGLKVIEDAKTTLESATCRRMEAVYLNYRRIDKIGCKVAKTLCARDYKGFGTGFGTMNGVIEDAKTTRGGNQQPMIIVAMRGRNPDNPKSRGKSNYEQRLEPNTQGICNTLTSVQKDNLVLEEKPIISDGYRLRKLTPRECWRLMGFSDADFDKAAAVNSNTQLYKEAGNSIVKNVLMAIFRRLNIQGENPQKASVCLKSRA